ncbi:MAG: hypothetical protein ACHQAX_06770 [Gammaproteobacteria bacterium]
MAKTAAELKEIQEKRAARIKKYEEDLIAQEKSFAAAKGNLTKAGVNEIELNQYETRYVDTRIKQSARRASLQAAQGEKFKLLAETTTYLDGTSGTNNNCLIFSLQKNVASGLNSLNINDTRKQLYEWYDILFASDFPNNVNDKIIKKFNDDFGVKPEAKSGQVKTALQALNTVLKGYGDVQDWAPAVKPDFDKAPPTELRALFHDTGSPSRMLNTADAVLLSVLVKREIILVSAADGQTTVLNPKKIVNALFHVEAGKLPAYIQHNGTNHFQGINKDGIERYKEIIVENEKESAALAAEVAKDEASLLAAESAICRGQAGDFKLKFKNYRDGFLAVEKTKSDLVTVNKAYSSAAPISTAPTAASGATTAAALPSSSPKAAIIPEIKHVSDARAALEAAGVDKTALDWYEARMCDRERRQITVAGATKIVDSKKPKLVELLKDSTNIVITLSLSPNSFLLALQADPAFSKLDADINRKSIFRWYQILFADNFTANVDDDVVNLIKGEFGFNGVDIPATTVALRALKVAIQKEFEKKYGKKPSDADILIELTKPGRPLNRVDILVEAARLNRAVHVVSMDGSLEIFDPRISIGAPFRVAGYVVVQHEGKNHFHGINAAPNTELDRYIQIVAKETAARAAVSRELEEDDIVLNSMEAGICAGKDPTTVKANFQAYKKEAIAAAKVEAISPKLSAGPAPLVTDQLVALNAMRQNLVKSLAVAAAASPPPPVDFLSELERRQDARNSRIKERDELKKGNDITIGSGLVLSKKARFQQVLFDPPPAAAGSLSATNLGAAASANLHEALGLSAAAHVTYQNRILNAQLNIDDAAGVEHALSELSPVLREVEGEVEKVKALALVEEAYLKLDSECINLYHDLEEAKTAAHIRLVALGKPILADQERSVLEPVTRIEKLLEEKNVLRGQSRLEVIKIEDSLLPEYKAMSLAALADRRAPFEAEIDLAKADNQVIENAFSEFEAKMAKYNAEQQAGTGAVHNPYDVQWTAILRQQTIVVVQKDGSTREFKPDIFGDIDLADLTDHTLLDRAKAYFFDNLDVPLDAALAAPDDVVYVYDNQEAGAARGYHAFTAPGQAACRAAKTDADAALTEANDRITAADAVIANHLAGLNAHPALQLEAQAYSVLLGRAKDAIREGKPLADVIGVPAPAQPAWEAKLDKISTEEGVSVTTAQDNQRDIHRQNIDVLLTLLLQGTLADRNAFDDVYVKAVANPLVINLKAGNSSGHNYGIPFDTAPMFYAKGMTQPALVALTGADAEARILDLLTKEINAYLEMKKISPDSTLAKDYKAVLVAIQTNILPVSVAATGLKDIPDSSLKPILEGIHQRVDAKAAHVANVIEHNAYNDKYGAMNSETIRQGIHDYRVAKGTAATPTYDSTKAPQAAHAVKQTSYMNATKPRVVFDIKGMTVAQVMAAFNENTDARNLQLTVKSDKGEDCRIAAELEGGRLKLVLQNGKGGKGPLTKNVWLTAEAKVKEVINEIAGQGAALTLTSSKNEEPRKRGNKP